MLRSITKAGSIATLALIMSGYSWTGAGTSDTEFFERQVAPILCGRCASCHNEQMRASDLSFYTRKEVLEGGERGSAVVPYKPSQSILIHAINRDGGLMKFPVMMPPGPKLADKDIETLTEWVRRGAPWGKQSLACALGAPPPI